ncbi:MAG: bacteriophage abortive infection AbiH family protein [bacterium]|nr:bacteriophage abortive infection AbiH family protein [bacterium]MCM1423705.1 bacteriophage abortive infection AbiH family protein [bacterium]
MNILIIGNGFDLAHDLPTSYSDVLNFLHKIMHTSTWHGTKNEFISTHLDKVDIDSPFYNYIIKAFDSRIENNQGNCTNSNPIIQEIYDNLDDNIWYTYFCILYSKGKMRGINWIDFESEISHIIEHIDREEENIYLPFRNLESDKDEKLDIFFHVLPIGKFIHQADKAPDHQPTFRNFLDKSYSDLRQLIRCIEIYLTEYIETMPIAKFSPDIKSLNIHAVLNFNYTHTYAKNYFAGDNVKIHYIHGETRISASLTENNMVLGIDEYYDENEKNNHTNYNIYKKFTQRILNETGFTYRNWIKNINDNYQRFQNRINKGYMEYDQIFIFGHSLDITDKDVLKDLIYRPSVQTTIFYHDKQQQTQQIANLVKMLGQNNFIEMVNHVPQKIKFIKQAEMKCIATQ